MKKKLNIFILNDKLEAAGKLRRYLSRRFGNMLNVSLYLNSEYCVNMMNRHVDLIFIDDYLYEWGSKDAYGVELLKTIKDRSPHTVVVILRSNVGIAESIEALQHQDNAYIINKISNWQRLQNLIDQTVGQPIKYLVAEFGVQKFMKVFFFTFASLALTCFVLFTL